MKIFILIVSVTFLLFNQEISHAQAPRGDKWYKLLRAVDSGFISDSAIRAISKDSNSVKEILQSLAVDEERERIRERIDDSLTAANRPKYIADSIMLANIKQHEDQASKLRSRRDQGVTLDPKDLDLVRTSDSMTIRTDYLQLEDFTYERTHATIPAFQAQLDKDIADTKQVIEFDERDYRFHYGVSWQSPTDLHIEKK
jgi:hypothetical protein